MAKKNLLYFNREISWLAFNERVLQEAADSNVPLLERLKFLGIFSSNMDEFFRVRVATVRRLLNVKKSTFNLKERVDVKKLLEEIQQQVRKSQKKFDLVYFQLIEDLKAKNIHFIDESMLSLSQKEKTRQYFNNEVISRLFPIILQQHLPFPFLKDKSIYLAIKMTQSNGAEKKYALLEIPTGILNRFFVLQDKESYSVMFLDDVIRYNLPALFSSLNFDTFDAYTIKLTRDAELDLDSDLSESILEKVKKSLKQRKAGNPVRFIYDEKIPKDLLNFLAEKIKIPIESMIPGQRYHNFKDFIKFPDIKGEGNRYKVALPVAVPEFDTAKNMFDVIARKDRLLSHPYQSFDYVVRFLREAAIDPLVVSIKITLYRVAEHSNIVNALINAVKNGKKVFVVMELRARFDEEHNIYWANKLKDEGAQVFFGIPNIKIHSKVCLIQRREKNKLVNYAHISTGNYNGQTARLYCDHSIFTARNSITTEAARVFSLIANFGTKSYKFSKLLIAPVNLKKTFLDKIEQEIKFAKKKKDAYIIFKMNSLVDKELIDKLYDASRAGVKIVLIIRGICCLVPGVKGMSDNIEVVSIVDKYLEHARIYVFGNGGKEEMFLGSADLMTRNLQFRIEVLLPILDKQIKLVLNKLLELQLTDNIKARHIDKFLENEYVKNDLKPVRAQDDFYKYLRKETK